MRDEGVEPASLVHLLESSRVVFVLATPTTENAALLSRELLELVRPDAVLVLVSRAHVVDFEALTELVLAGCFRAAIDVFPYEPLDPGHPIRTASRAVLSPHRAGLVQEALWEIGRLVVDDLEAIVQRAAAAPPASRAAGVRNPLRQDDADPHRVPVNGWPELDYKPSFPEDYRPGIGIVGCGGIVRSSHLPSYARYGQRVVGVYDVRPEATVGIREEYGVEVVFDDLAELLRHPDVEIVDIATHPEVRPALVRDALAAGKHVLAQKPLAEDLDTARELVEEAERLGLGWLSIRTVAGRPRGGSPRCSSSKGRSETSWQ